VNLRLTSTLRGKPPAEESSVERQPQRSSAWTKPSTSPRPSRPASGNRASSIPLRRLHAVVVLSWTLVLVLVASSVAPAATSEDPSPQFNPPKSYYLALGDSFTYGFQLRKVLAGLPPSAFDTGYVDIFAARLRAIRPDLTAVNYGCPGESTATFITGPCPWTAAGRALHDDFQGSQLDAAVAFLGAHPGHVSPITLQLFGNDMLELIRFCGGDFGCIQREAPPRRLHNSVRG
jgi:hypothetical protein